MPTADIANHSLPEPCTHSDPASRAAPQAALDILVAEIAGTPTVKGGRYTAHLGERLLCTAREPLFAAARVLLAEGIDPTTPVTMIRANGKRSIKTTVGAAAKLHVNESARDGKPRIVPYKPYAGPRA